MFGSPDQPAVWHLRVKACRPPGDEVHSECLTPKPQTPQGSSSACQCVSAGRKQLLGRRSRRRRRPSPRLRCRCLVILIWIISRRAQVVVLVMPAGSSCHRECWIEQSAVAMRLFLSSCLADHDQHSAVHGVKMSSLMFVLSFAAAH